MKTSLNYAQTEPNRSALYLTVAVWFVIMMVYYVAMVGFPQQDLVDTDAFTRLVRVEQFAADHNWYNSDIPRSNAPYGETLHWTRPMDILLLLGAGLLTPIFGFHQALYWWGIVISPILGALSLAALAWASKPVSGVEEQRLQWLLFIGQILLVSAYQFGRPDHHGLLALLFIGLLGCLLRLVQPGFNRSLCLWAGVLAAVAVWVSVEALTGVVLVFIALTIMWVKEGAGYLRKLGYFNLALLLSSGLFLLLEHHPALLLQVEYDRISSVHIFMMALAAVSIWALSRFTPMSNARRVGAALAVALIDGLILWLAFPEFLKGPFSQVNPAIIPIWLNQVQEVQLLWSESRALIVSLAGPMLLSLGYLCCQIIRKSGSAQFKYLLTLLIGLLIFIPLTVYQIRWVYYYSIIVVIPLSMFLQQILMRMSAIRLNSLRALARAGIILFFIGGFTMLGLLLNDSAEEQQAAENKPDTRSLCAWLNDPSAEIPSSAVILAFMDYGPEILYRTPHQVIATPYHRNDAGILFNYRVMTAADEKQAQVIISERQVDLIILTPESAEKSVYNAGQNPPAFYNQLLEGQVPPWLVAVPAPEHLQPWFLIYRVVAS